MARKTIDGQRQHADIDQRDGQAPERLRDGLAAQTVVGLRHQHDGQQIAEAAAEAEAHALLQRKALGALHQHRAQHTAVDCGSRQDAEQLAAVASAPRCPEHKEFKQAHHRHAGQIDQRAELGNWHDRTFLDGCIDHVLSINKTNIEVQKGNFSSWQENKERLDLMERTENERLKKDVKRLNAAARQASGWSDKVEKTKIGTHAADRGAIGHKAAKMMKRAKALEARREQAAAEKSRLLKNVEEEEALSLSVLEYPKNCLLEVENLFGRLRKRPGIRCRPVFGRQG